MPTPTIHNGYDYSDLRATSFLPFVPGQTGLIVWPKDSVISAGGREPIALATLDDKLLIRYSDFLELRQRGNGTLIWGREVHFGTDLQATSAGVITRSHAGFYQTISYESRVFEGYFLPFLGERTHLNWVLPDTKETRYAYCSAPVPVHGPSGTPIEAAGVYARYMPEEERLLWFFERTGAPRGARVTGDGATVCLGTLNFIDIFPANADSTTKFISLPVENLHAVAINQEDKILAIDEFEGKKRLRCLERDGSERWSTVLKAIGEVSQPPISAPGFRCWITVGATLYHFVEDKLVWEYSVPAEEKLFITVCADNTLLIACGSLFTILSEQGQPIINRVFAGKFTCRPLVDEQGRVFLGGTQGLLCIR